MKKKIGLILTLLVSMFILSSCDYSKGEEVEIRNQCLGCFDRPTFNLSVQYAQAHDQDGFNSLITSRSTTLLVKGLRGRVLVCNKASVVLEMDCLPGKRVWVLKRNIGKPKKKRY